MDNKQISHHMLCQRAIHSVMTIKQENSREGSGKLLEFPLWKNDIWAKAWRRWRSNPSRFFWGGNYRREQGKPQGTRVFWVFDEQQRGQWLSRVSRKENGSGVVLARSQPSHCKQSFSLKCKKGNTNEQTHQRDFKNVVSKIDILYLKLAF